MYEQKEKQKIQKSPKNEVIQCYKIKNGRKVSDDESLWLEPGVRTHRFWAKKGLFDEQVWWLYKSKINLYKEQEEEEFDLITAEYKGKRADEMIAPSDCGEFTKLILGTKEPHAIFGLGSNPVETKTHADPAVYKEEIIDKLAKEIGSMSRIDCWLIGQDGKSFLEPLIAPLLLMGKVWAVQEFREAVWRAIPTIVSESRLLFDKVMEDTDIKQYVLEECQNKTGFLQTSSSYRGYKIKIQQIEENNYKESLWEMKKVICYLMEIKRREVMLKLEAFAPGEFRRVATQSVTLLGLVKKLDGECLDPKQGEVTIPLYRDVLGALKPEQLERFISENPSLARHLHVNQYAVPLVGYGYVISSGGNDISGRSGRMWPHHWAGVVMQSEDKKDQIVMENYYCSERCNNRWCFDMVGIKKGQTFHDIHKGSLQHGDVPVTMVAAY